MATIYATVKNQKITTLAAACTDSATSIDVTSATNLGIPSISGGNFYYVTLITAATWRQNPLTTPETFEIVKVTAVSIGGGTGGSDRLTVTRAQDNTTGTAFSANDVAELRMCAKNLDEITAIAGTTTGTNTGDVTLSGENYLSLTSQALTANAVNVSGSNITGTLKAASFPALTGDVTTSAGSLATTIANLAVTNAKIANSTIDLTAKVTGVLPGANGGTGVANTSKTITLGGNLTTSGAFNTTFTVTADTNVTLPTSGTLVNSAVTTLSSLVSVGTITTGTWNGTVIVGTYGGTGVNNGTKTITLGGNLTTSGAFNTTLTVTADTNVTLPTSGTLVNTAVATLSSLTSVGTLTSLTISGDLTVDTNTLYVDSTNNRVVIGATTGSSDLSFGGEAARTIAVNRKVSGGSQADLSVRAGGGISGATKTAGGRLFFSAGVSTGNAQQRQIAFQRYVTGSSGTTDQTLINAISWGHGKAFTNNTFTTVLSATVANDTTAAYVIDYAVEVKDGTDQQTEVGRFLVAICNKGGTVTTNTATATTCQLVTAGTLACSIQASAANPSVVQLKFNSSLTPSSGYPFATYHIENMTSQAMTTS